MREGGADGNDTGARQGGGALGEVVGVITWEIVWFCYCGKSVPLRDNCACGLTQIGSATLRRRDRELKALLNFLAWICGKPANA